MKTKQHSTDPKRITKSARRKEFDKKLPFGFFNANPPTEERLFLISEDLLLMIDENSKMITLGPWMNKYGLDYKTIMRWKERFPKFKEVYEHGKDMLGKRIFEKAFYKEGDSNMARFSLANYDPEFRALEEWRNNLKKEIAQESGSNVIEVKVPTFYATGVVPDKVTD